jgi:sugar phosphate isomerase/epimerase
MYSKSALIGNTGFIGKNISYSIDFSEYYNSKNIKDIINKKFKLIICCGISARKYFANQFPDEDLLQIKILIDCLNTIECDRFILISTIDVYPEINNRANEDTILDINEENNSYGKNRLYMENFVKSKFKNYNIIRLPGVFGFGLKKNIIYDLIFNKHPKIDIESQYQWYNLDWLVDDINYVIENDIKIINLFPEPLVNKEWIYLFETNKYQIIKKDIKYDIQTKYHSSFYWKTKESVLNSLIRYIKIMNNNNICISNLCFSECVDDNIMLQFGIDKLEVAPFKFFGKDFINNDLSFFEQWKNKIYSFQSLLYPHTFNIFSESNKFKQYIFKLIDIAFYLNVKILVLGSPKNRKIDNSISEEEILNLFIELGDYCKEKNIILCIEPNSKLYGCNFITTSTEGYEFCKKINHLNIKLNLDIGSMQMENESIYENIFKYKDQVAHIHFSAPYLKSIKSNTHIFYNYIYNQLYKTNYNGKVTLETLNQEIFDIQKDIYELVRVPRVGIIGAGWYGCHIAKRFLNIGYTVNIFEKNSEIFSMSSIKNQNRLHLGFHYPRSYNTRKLCIENYHKFINEYSQFLYDISENYYIIANDSLVDYQTYINIMTYEKIPFKIGDNMSFKNNTGTLLVDEKFIDNRAAKKFFENLLKNNIYLNKKVDVDQLKYDYVFDCTNNQSNNIKSINNKNIYYELTLSLLYKSKINNIAYTIVDGPFSSLYPHDLSKNLYTLTNVKYTPILIDENYENIEKYKLSVAELNILREKMENEIKTYIEDFDLNFKYSGYFLSTKTKFINKSDNRELIVSTEKNRIYLFCGKISGIYDINLDL